MDYRFVLKLTVVCGDKKSGPRLNFNCRQRFFL